MSYIDPTKVSAENYRTLMENEHVRVLEMKLPAGATDSQHSHPNETVYFLSGGTVRIHLPEGNPIEAELPNGHVMWHDAWTHKVENVGETDIHAIIVEDVHSRSEA